MSGRRNKKKRSLGRSWQIRIGEIYTLDREQVGLVGQGEQKLGSGTQFLKKSRGAKNGYEMVKQGSKSMFYIMIRELFAKLDILVCIKVVNI